MEISLEGGRVVGPRLLLSDKRYVRAKRPLKPQHGPLPLGWPRIFQNSSRTSLQPESPLDQSRKAMKCCLVLHGCLDAGGSLFVVEADPMKIWLQ